MAVAQPEQVRGAVVVVVHLRQEYYPLVLEIYFLIRLAMVEPAGLVEIHQQMVQVVLHHYSQRLPQMEVETDLKVALVMEVVYVEAVLDKMAIPQLWEEVAAARATTTREAD